MICPQCGGEMREGAQFCSQCGTSPNTQEGIQQEERTRPRWVWRVNELRWVILAYVLASCVCMSCACLLGYRTQWILWRLGLR